MGSPMRAILAVLLSLLVAAGIVAALLVARRRVRRDSRPIHHDLTKDDD